MWHRDCVHQGVSILLWHPVYPRVLQTTRVPRRTPGAYAGRARFLPRNPRRLPDGLRSVIGRVIEFGFAATADADHPFAGQSLYLEWRTDNALDGFLIPEQDLEFLSESSDPRG